MMTFYLNARRIVSLGSSLFRLPGGRRVRERLSGIKKRRGEASPAAEDAGRCRLSGAIRFPHAGATALLAILPLVHAASASLIIEREFQNLDLSLPDLETRTNLQTVDIGDLTVDRLGVSLTLSGASSADPAFNGDYFISIANDHGGYAVLANRVGRTSTSGAGSFGYSDNGFSVLFEDTAMHDIHLYRNHLDGPLASGTPVTGGWQPSGRAALPEDVLDTTERTAMLGSFAGLDLNGDWWITVADTAMGGAGTLKGWGLQMEVTPQGSGELRFAGGDRIRTEGDLQLGNNLHLGGETTVSGAGNITLSGRLDGGGNLVREGAGTLILGGDSVSFTGDVEVNGGRLEVANTTGSATGQGDVSIAHNGILSGSGRVGGSTFLAAGGVIAPGESPGRLEVANLTWGENGIYEWEINLADGQAGVDPGWDLIVVENGLSVTATAENPFVVKVLSLGLDNNPGELSGFSATESSQWLILSAQEITGLSMAAVELDLQQFSEFNSIPAGWEFALSQSGADLYLNYIPEPLTGALAAGLASGLLVLLRRRERTGRRRRGTALEK